MAKVQGRLALRVLGCYRTMSFAAAAVLAGIPPIHLLAQERLEISNGTNRAEARKRLMELWQSEWELETKGRFTYRIMPKISYWNERRYGETNFKINQVFTGHGCFGAYLNRFKIQNHDRCSQCGDHLMTRSMDSSFAMLGKTGAVKQ